MLVYRVAYEMGGMVAVPHAEDLLTENAAEQRVKDLKATGLLQVTYYAVEGDGIRGCWCPGHAGAPKVRPQNGESA